MSNNFIISEVKKIPNKRGEFLYDIHLDKGMLVEIVKMESGCYYTFKSELCITIRIVKKYNLQFPDNSNRGKVYMLTINNLAGLEFEDYILRGNEERCQKIEKLIGLEDRDE